jgi:hypothetical protein
MKRKNDETAGRRRKVGPAAFARASGVVAALLSLYAFVLLCNSNLTRLYLSSPHTRTNLFSLHRDPSNATTTTRFIKRKTLVFQKR